MPDIENVIKGLKYLHDVKRWSPNESEESITARRNITGDALALLKAQEPVKPLKMAIDHIRKEPVVFSYECPVCMCGLQRHWVACPICGRTVKWE